MGGGRCGPTQRNAANGKLSSRPRKRFTLMFGCTLPLNRTMQWGSRGVRHTSRVTALMGHSTFFPECGLRTLVTVGRVSAPRHWQERPLSPMCGPANPLADASSAQTRGIERTGPFVGPTDRRSAKGRPSWMVFTKRAQQNASFPFEKRAFGKWSNEGTFAGKLAS